MKNFLILLIVIFFQIKLNASEINQQESNIFKNLRCLVCQGQSISESNSDFAQTIKLVVKDQINSGKTDREIYDFLISKYGEWIFYKPSLKSHNMILWFGPYLMIFFGGLLIWKLIRKRKNNKVY